MKTFDKVGKMENMIYRTKRNGNGKFDSLTVCHDVRQATYRIDDYFVNKDCRIITFAQMQAIRRDLEKNGYKVFVLYGWERH